MAGRTTVERCRLEGVQVRADESRRAGGGKKRRVLKRTRRFGMLVRSYVAWDMPRSSERGGRSVALGAEAAEAEVAAGAAALAQEALAAR